jgi:hypothetical protein
MKVKEITGEHILFDDGTEVTQYHNQDCCENVYADFEQLKTTPIDWEDFKEIKLVKVPDTGIRIVGGYLIPCYNKQNGYYSSDLELIVKYPDGREERTDISDCVEDHIE